MTFERLDSIANRVISRLVVDGLGEAEIAVSALRPKGTPTEAGAKWEVSSRGSPVDALPANKANANRSMITASPTRHPSSAVVIDLSVYREQRRHHATPF